MAGQIYNRKLHKYEEDVQYGGGLLEILYHKRVGRIFLKWVVHPLFSRIYGWYQSTSFSKRKIAAFVEKYRIAPEEYEQQEFNSFRDFFIRKIKPEARPIDKEECSFIAPADSKLSVYEIEDADTIGVREQLVKVKGEQYTLEELVGGGVALTGYEGGYCLVFRLSMDDYHRYSFVDSGRVRVRYALSGKLHTVSSISAKHKIYRENSRVVNVLDCENFGEIIWIEVGALLVGRIQNHPITLFQKGMEKGYFEPGGSTILLLIKPGQIRPDADIEEICRTGAEVKVQLGEKIGTKR